MTWVAIDDRATSHPKLLRVGPDGVTIWLAGLCYCNSFATDGRIPKVALGGLYPPIKRPEKVAEKLVSEGLWEDRGDAWEVHDYEHYQAEAMKPEAEARREKARLKKAAQRNKKKMSPGDAGGQRGGQHGGHVPGTVPGTFSPPARPGPTNLLTEVEDRGTVPPPQPSGLVASPKPDWVIVTECATKVALWQGDLSASPRTMESTAKLVALAKITAAQRNVTWPVALEYMFQRWYADKPGRLRMPNWPMRLVEDWHDTKERVDAEDEQNPTHEARP